MRAAAAAAMGLVIALVCLEAVSRAYVQSQAWPLGDRYLVQPTPYFSPRASPAPPHYSDLRMIENPQALAFVDSPGVSAEYTWHKPADTLRIVCLGDSLTQVWPGTPNYTHSLQAALTAHLGQPVEVIALGVGGYNPRLTLAAFFNWARRLDPDLLVLQLGPNDVDLLTYTSAPLRPGIGQPGGRFRESRRPGRQPYGLFGYNQKEPRTEPASHAAFWLSFAVHNWALGDRNHGLSLVHDKAPLSSALQAYAGLARELSVPAPAIVFPFFESRHSNLEETRIATALQEAQVPALFLREALSQEASLQDLSTDGIHPTPLAHRVAGQAVSRYLIQLALR